ncbi:MAG: hypothetical protein GF310_14320 [candidate division Zixibacteria bacterium]|nr:hypothetical protein [candidate division Zixibacteria bacterium]
MSSSEELVVSLKDKEKCLTENVGGKGENLSRLLAEGFRVPDGFCLTVRAYKLFIESNQIDREIRVELGRKALSKMRWEEIWDSALRIRSMFLRFEMPEIIVAAVKKIYDELKSAQSFVVRSSSPSEDSSGMSFAGLHESIVDVRSFDELIKAIKIVWSSLWSDAALLYRKEMGLDPGKSAMAVVVQEYLQGGPSGVAFTRDPRNMQLEQSVIEAVPGSNNELVDGLVEPDRWVILRSSHEVAEWNPGKRPDQKYDRQLLTDSELRHLYDNTLSVESKFGWAADVEWTGKLENLHILQSRPITSGTKKIQDDQRQWYLSLRPKMQKLKKLAKRVDEELLPQLKRETDQLSQQTLTDLNDRELAKVIKERLNKVRKWRKIYYDEFIPLAHGVRQLGIYYNNEVKPDNPYEFMVLLKGQDLLASRRNSLIDRLAQLIIQDNQLAETIGRFLENSDSEDPPIWDEIRPPLKDCQNGNTFVEMFEKLINDFTHVSFKGENLSARPDIYLHTIMEITVAKSSEKHKSPESSEVSEEPEELMQKLFDAVGEERHSEAKDMVQLGRLSWKLRDDDNILVGQLESFLLEALNLAGQRLKQRGLLDKYEKLNDTAALILSDALLYPPDESIELPQEKNKGFSILGKQIGKPRQLVGQPASPGIASGSARIVHDSNDLKEFKFGEILICDAIQPTMTHIVPLASAIVERRGGMLIHGAIIARELGIPCVNGVADAAELIEAGEFVTVDGYLGIVTVGEAEFDLERSTGREGPE